VNVSIAYNNVLAICNLYRFSIIQDSNQETPVFNIDFSSHLTPMSASR